MSYEQFYDGPPELTVAYRQAWRIKRETANKDLWLQGAYIYQAIARVSPLYNFWSSKGRKPIDWMSEPFPIYQDAEPNGDQEIKMSEEKKPVKPAVAMMQQFMAQHNAELARRKAKEAKADSDS